MVSLQWPSTPKRKFKTEEEEERERKGRPDFDVDTIARLHEVFENCEPGRGVTEEVFRDFLEKANMKASCVDILPKCPSRTTPYPL
nr:hypothetical protein BaRGS_021067 [Batillaria attramentaria]